MDPISLLTHLEHPNSWIDAHDLWSIRNQILHDLKYLASQGLYHEGLNLSNVLVCSLRPISNKLSLFSNSHVTIGFVNTEIPIQEFWKLKMNEHEEVCLDDFIRSIVKSVFPYSIIDKNIVFTNPNTLERSDLASLKALICSIEFETMFKSGQFVGDFVTINTNLSCFFKSFKSQEQKTLFFPNTLLFHIFTQGIFSLFDRKFKDSYFFKKKFTCISSNFRNVFLRAYDSACESRGQIICFGLFDLDFSNYIGTVNLFLYSHCSRLKSLNLSNKLVKNIAEISKLSNLEFLDLSYVLLFNWPWGHDGITDISFLSSCIKLKSLSLDGSGVTDLSPLSLLSHTLKSLSLKNTPFSNLSQLSLFKQLEHLSLFHKFSFEVFPNRKRTCSSQFALKKILQI
ncbi:hypothetical protein RCL1_006280 [Eukaryota sp. TZLM3-RCL]